MESQTPTEVTPTRLLLGCIAYLFLEFASSTYSRKAGVRDCTWAVHYLLRAIERNGDPGRVSDSC